MDPKRRRGGQERIVLKKGMDGRVLIWYRLWEGGSFQYRKEQGVEGGSEKLSGQLAVDA